MIFSFHEKPIVSVNASGGQPRASVVHGSASPGSRCGNEDSGFTADTRGSASGMDCRGPGDDASELESLDAQGERTGAEGPGTSKATGASGSFNSQGASAIGRPPGAVPFGVWAEPGSLGRPHISGPPEASFRDNPEGSPGPVLDAPARLPAETLWVFVPSRTKLGGQAISPALKKNSSPSKRARRSSLRMKRVLRCILGSGLGGRRWESGCVFQRRASIGRG